MTKRLVEKLYDLEKQIQSIQKYHQKHQEKWDELNQAGDTDKNMQKIKKPLEKMERILDELLAAPDKSYQVTFKGKQYNFIYPTTSIEYIAMMYLRRELIVAVVSHCIVQMSCGDDTWWMVRAFAQGTDPLDMQIEIIKENSTDFVDNVHNVSRSIPLDENNFQVKWELSNDNSNLVKD